MALLPFLSAEKTSIWEKSIIIKTMAMLSVWSSTIIILLGRQGPLVALASVVGDAFSSLVLVASIVLRARENLLMISNHYKYN